jgi:hypothetical protein
MVFLSASLGVRCGFCHVNPFPSDAKENKKTARKMMRMVFEINRTNFGGKMEVTCYMCHQGQAKPVSTPRAGMREEMFAAAAKTPEIEKTGTPPTVDEVVARYEKAAGGAQAVEHARSMEIRGVETESGGHSTAVVLEMKTSKEVPVMGRAETATDRGPYVEGFDGVQAWSAAQGKHEQPTGFEQRQLKWELELNPVAELKKPSAQARVAGRVRIEPREEAGTNKNAAAKEDSGGTGSEGQYAYVVEINTADGGVERFFFDVNSGLLVRRATIYQTFLGPIPLEEEYGDYRAVDGVQTSFATYWSAGNSTRKMEAKQVKYNVPMEDGRFREPSGQRQ